MPCVPLSTPSGWFQEELPLTIQLREDLAFRLEHYGDDKDYWPLLQKDRKVLGACIETYGVDGMQDEEPTIEGLPAGTLLVVVKLHIIDHECGAELPVYEIEVNEMGTFLVLKHFMDTVAKWTEKDDKGGGSESINLPMMMAAIGVGSIFVAVILAHLQ